MGTTNMKASGCWSCNVDFTRDSFCNSGFDNFFLHTDIKSCWLDANDKIYNVYMMIDKTRGQV